MSNGEPQWYYDQMTKPYTNEPGVPEGKTLINFFDAMEKLSRDERFKATVYAMNTLLVQKGIYSPEEFEFQFRQYAQKHSE